MATAVVGCGSTQTAPGDDVTPTATNSDNLPSPLISFGEDGMTSVMWLIEEEKSKTERVLPRERYRVFQRPQTQRESEMTRRIERDFLCSASENDASEKYGEPVSELTRILLGEIGDPQYDLVAEATTRGLVGYKLFPEGSGSCGSSSPDGFALSAEVRGRAAIVYGLVPDGVVAVDLVVDGMKLRARLGENGYASEVPDAVGKTLERVFLHRTDGSVTEIPSNL
jgi:hypothetical protein